MASCRNRSRMPWARMVHWNSSSSAISIRKRAASCGQCKGFDFEADLYDALAEMGRQLGDETQCVRGVQGALKRKTGDHVIKLGDTTGAPGLRIVIEAKDQKYKAKQAIDELQEAKKN